MLLIILMGLMSPCIGFFAGLAWSANGQWSAKRWRNYWALFYLLLSLTFIYMLFAQPGAGKGSRPLMDDVFPIFFGFGIAGPMLFSAILGSIPKDKGDDDDVLYCHKCEYDLTGNVSGVCPECGTNFDSGDAR